MSDELSKKKHSKRIYDDQVHIEKQLKIAKAHGVEVKEPHKLNKHNVLDCGNPKCVVCSSPRKIFKQLTIQEKSFNQTKDWD
jgi:hypothetical protein